MKTTCALACLGLCLSTLAHSQSAVPEIKFDSAPNFFQLPTGMYFGEVTGIAVNSKKHIFVLSRGNTSGPAYGAAARIRFERQVRARDRTQSLCMVFRSCGASRSGGQYLGCRQGFGHGGAV